MRVKSLRLTAAFMGHPPKNRQLQQVNQGRSSFDSSPEGGGGGGGGEGEEEGGKEGGAEECLHDG